MCPSPAGLRCCLCSRQQGAALAASTLGSRVPPLLPPACLLRLPLLLLLLLSLRWLLRLPQLLLRLLLCLPWLLLSS